MFCNPLLRPWIPGLYKKPSRTLRKKLNTNSKKFKVAIKRVKADGSVSVSCAQKWFATGVKTVLSNKQIKLAFGCLWPRSGGPGLKKTQTYPAGYGKRIYELHRLYQEPCSLCLFFLIGFPHLGGGEMTSQCRTKTV